MKNITIITIPCSVDNYSYLLVCEKTRNAAVIDPTEPFIVMGQVEKHNVNLTTVLCTHHHSDHVGDIDYLIQEIPSLKVFCHSLDTTRIPSANHYLDNGDQISVGEMTGEVLHTPGHTTGSVCYRFDDILFTGDTLFGAGCGRLFEGSPEQMHTSLNSIAQMKDATKLFFGHEYTKTNLAFALTVDPNNSDVLHRLAKLQDSPVSTPTTLALEKKTNPFLRCDSAIIKGALQDNSIEDPQSPLDVFTALRTRRNSF